MKSEVKILTAKSLPVSFSYLLWTNLQKWITRSKVHTFFSLTIFWQSSLQKNYSNLYFYHRRVNTYLSANLPMVNVIIFYTLLFSWQNSILLLISISLGKTKVWYNWMIFHFEYLNLFSCGLAISVLSYFLIDL